MPTAKISVREEDIIRLTLEFLYNRELHISQLSVERETGVINGSYSDDTLFLRQLILDGQWDDVLEFIQPLEAIPTFPTNRFRYCILRHKYAELICMKSEATVVGSVDTAVEEVVKVLNELEKVCPTKDEYSNLCLMLTLPRLSDNLGYKDWNPSTARVQCFKQVYPLVMKFLPCDKKPVMPDSTNDRLIQLIIKGMLYESCCNFCKSKAVGSKQPFGPNVLNFSHIFNGSEGYNDTDLSLMSWLQSIPAETFIVPFEQKTLNVELEQLERPSLETSWTEHMLVTPIKPKQFPHSAMPFTRPRSAADIMSRSLLPNLDQTTSSSSLISSIGMSNSPSNLVKSSFASFHLTGLKSNTPMTTSVDKLFESEVFANSINGELPSITEVLTPVKENRKNISELSSPEPGRSSANSTTTSNTTRSSRRDSLTDRYQSLSINQSSTSFDMQNSQCDLFKEYQRQKQRYHDALQDQERERLELIQQLRTTESKLQDENGELSNRVVTTDSSSFLKNSAAKPPIPTKINVTNGNKGEWTSANDNSKEIPNMTATAAALKRLEALFEDAKISDGGGEPAKTKRGSVEKVHFAITADCDIHGDGRRKSEHLHHNHHLHRGSVVSGAAAAVPRRDSVPASIPAASMRRRDSIVLGSPGRDTLCHHPSSFPSSLRRDSSASSTSSLRRDSVHSARRDSLSPSPVSSSAGVALRRESSGAAGRKDSSAPGQPSWRRFSTDSLDSLRRNSWDPNGRRGSSGSSAGCEDPIWEDKPTSTAVGGMKSAATNYTGDGLPDGGNNDQSGKPRFIAVTRLEDVQAVRCAEFHPHGSVYAVGSNSKTLRICAYPKVTDIRENHVAQQPAVLFKRTRHHKGSIYCMSWTPDGSLIATGSNDKTVKLMKFNADTSNLEGQEIELAMHDGTVRDVCFIEDTTNRSSLLVSGGAGDCKIYVTDCETGQPYQALSGHSGHILTLYNWGGAMFVSGSHDRTIRFWDLRTRGCVNVVTPNTSVASRGSPVAAVCVEPSGRLLVSGHEDSACVLYDIRGSRSLQCFKPHSADVRSLRFSPSAYYLLTGGYDNKLVLTDLQGDLTTSLPSVVVAQHQDKVISGRWHPTDFSFLSTSADKTTTLWALPPYK